MVQNFMLNLQCCNIQAHNISITSTRMNDPSAVRLKTYKYEINKKSVENPPRLQHLSP